MYHGVNDHVTNIGRHNAPVESPYGSGQPGRRSLSEASFTGGSPSKGNIIRSDQPQGLPSQPMSNPSGTMAIGSIIEPTMRHDYASPSVHAYADFSHLPVPVAPRMPSDLVYGVPPTDSPYPSSDSSYSPMSELIQPHVSTQSYSSPDDLPRAHSASLESTFPQHIFTSPLTTSSPISSWHFTQPPLSAPMETTMHDSLLPTVSKNFPSRLGQVTNSLIESTFPV